MTLLMLIFFIQTMFGCVIVMRTLQVFAKRGLISTKALTKTGTAFVFSLLLIDFYFKAQFFAGSLLISFLCIALFLILRQLEQNKMHAMRERVPLFLDRWILNLKLGKSSTVARDKAFASESIEFTKLIEPLFSAKLSGQKGKNHMLLPYNVILELEKISLHPHSALARLDRLRHLLKKSAEFRRKSGQAVRQTQIQSLILGLLQIALAGFVIHQYGWRKIYDLVFLSFVLSTLAVVAVKLMTRKSKWKI